LNPVAPKAQKKVPIPEDLNLDEWINEPEPEPEKDEGFDKNWDLPSKFDDSDDEETKSEESKSGKSKEDSKLKRVGPYYLGESKSPSSSQSSLDNIPMATLTKDDLGLKEEKLTSYKDNIKKYKPKKNAPQIKVLKDEDLPPGATASDDDTEEKTNEPNPFANINFNEPLRPEEQLPVRTHRLATQPIKEEKSKKTKKHREGKEKKHKSKKSTTTESPQKEGSLIDIDSTTPSTPVPTKPELLGFEEVGSPVPTENVPAKSEKKKKKSSKKDSKKEKDTKEKSGKDTKTKKSKKETTASSTTTTSSASSGAQSGKGVPKFKPLCQDDNLSIIYELRVNPKQSKKIMGSFAFKNLSKESIGSIEFSIPSTLNLKVSDPSTAKPTIMLQPGDTNSHNIILDIQAVQQPLKVSGFVTYVIGSAGSTLKKDFQLVIPVSAFIIPVKVTKEEFIGILTEGGPYVLSSTQVHVKPEEDFRSFVVSLATLLHVELITLDTAASFYGRSIQSHNVAIYVKQLPNNIVSVDLKSNDGQIVNALTAEVNSFFPRA